MNIYKVTESGPGYYGPDYSILDRTLAAAMIRAATKLKDKTDSVRVAYDSEVKE